MKKQQSTKRIVFMRAQQNKAVRVNPEQSKTYRPDGRTH